MPMDDAPLDEDALTALVDRFYARVRADDLLGPLFNSAIADWPDHLKRLSDFWSSVMLTSGRYHGNPMQAHLKHAGAIRPEMFSRWLALWEDTARAMLPPGAAETIIEKAHRIARSLTLALSLPAFPDPAQYRD